MRPVDPRLLRYARATRIFLALSVALGLAGAGLVVAQAVLIADVVVGAFQEGYGAGELRGAVAGLVAVACGRALVAWLTELTAHRSAAAVKSELRMRLLRRAVGLGPGWLSRQRGGDLVALATRGVDALDDYFAKYLPQLGLAVVVPVAVIARIALGDWISAAVVLGTLPLIPIFMVLIGWATEAAMGRRVDALARLSGHFLDVVAGLPTLKVFGRAKAQAESIRKITGEYRQATMRTLRVAFLSSFALELIATISVALVAVGIGMRLVHGELDLYTGLVILVLAPEAYLPLRQVGAHYHAAAEGVAVAERVFAVLQTPVPEGGDGRVGRLDLAVEDLVVRYEGRDAEALGGVSLAVREGETVALVGPSGVGKSTLVAALLGFVRPAEGRVLVGGRELGELDLEWWRSRVAWVPQGAVLFAGTVAENVRLARPDASDEVVRSALRDAGAGELDPERVLGDGGAGLSAGQRQRVALARAFAADRPVVILDEPTAALDGETEAEVVAAVGRLAVGRTVLVVSHRAAVLSVADRVVAMDPALRAGVLKRRTGLDSCVGRGRGSTTPPKKRGGRPPLGPLGFFGGVVLPRPLLALPGAAQRPRLALAGLLGALAMASAVGLMATSGWLISRASEQPPVLYLMVAVTCTRAFGIGRAVFRYAERLVSHDAVLRHLADVRVAVYRRLERLAPAGLRGHRGDLLSRIVTDVDALQDRYLRWLLPAVTAGVVSLLAVGFTAWLLPEAAIALALGLLVAGVGAPLVSAAVARRAERAVAPVRGELATRTVDLLGATAELTVAGALPRHLAEVERIDGRLTRIARRSAAATGLGSAITALACGLTVAAAAVAGAQATADGRLSGVWLATVVLTPLAAFEAVNGMPLAYQQRMRVRRSQDRLQEVMEAPIPAHEGEGEPPTDPYPITLDGVTVRYPQPGDARRGRGGTTPPKKPSVPDGGRAPRFFGGVVEPRPRPTDKAALQDVSLTLTPGHRVAIVGPSGSGKTTLANTLLRFLDPTEGHYSLSQYDADAVRRIVGLCAQDAHIFDSNLRENLRLAGPDATDADLYDALQEARLADWVRGLPDGLDTPVGANGAQLSGGQRQRLALARALLADFPVLVLDEPAEHLDLPTADALTTDLLAATEGRTTVLITHRLTGLDAVDEILVLDQGRIVQRGTYAELATTDGPFRTALELETGHPELVTP
ncbi:thiol reductant ABC exporter subunit CydD [Streptomyces boninensis]|uniref:thiol reductant ABC exporter subunit CydD n=1 Tax=Streptomyces boninensis TaxID=2039455 RepID=UPI003B21FC84